MQSNIGACEQARIALYSAIPSARNRFTEPPAASRPAGDDRWRKAGRAARFKMSGKVQGRTLSRYAP